MGKELEVDKKNIPQQCIGSMDFVKIRENCLQIISAAWMCRDKYPEVFDTQFQIFAVNQFKYLLKFQSTLKWTTDNNGMSNDGHNTLFNQLS